MGDEEKHDDHHAGGDDKHKGGGGGKGGGYVRYVRGADARSSISAFIVTFLVLAGITALVVWLVYRPHKPKFSVVGAAIYGVNASSPPSMISTTMQFTIVTRNPNERVSIYYQHLTAFVSYKDQAITPPITLPPLYHEKESTVAFSPVLGVGMVPVSPEVVNGLLTDEEYGVVGLKLVLMGKLRWKAGGIKTGWYGMYVRCEMLVGMKRGVVGEVPLLASPVCHVDV